MTRRTPVKFIVVGQLLATGGVYTVEELMEALIPGLIPLGEATTNDRRETRRIQLADAAFHLAKDRQQRLIIEAGEETIRTMPEWAQRLLFQDRHQLVPLDTRHWMDGWPTLVIAEERRPFQLRGNVATIAYHTDAAFVRALIDLKLLSIMTIHR